MKKRLLSMFLCLCMLLTMVPAALAAGTPEQDTSDSLPEADDNGVITLTDDISISSESWTLNDSVTIDLNNHTLTITGNTSINVPEKQTLTLKNGKLTANGYTYSKGVLAPKDEASLILENVEMNTTGSAILPSGDNAVVTVTNSKIDAQGTFTISTNASKKDGVYEYGTNYNITLKDSYLKADDNTHDTCGIMINVPLTLTVDNCTVIGGRQGMMVRAGTANIQNSTIQTTGEFYNDTDKDVNQYHSSNWGSGNEVPAAAITVGNYVNGDAETYEADAEVTLTNTKVQGTEKLPAIYADANTRFKSDVSISGEKTEVSGEIKAGQQTKAGQINVSITGGTFSTDVTNFLATGYTCMEDSGKYVVDVADGAQVDTTTDEDGNVTATVDGSYNGNENSEGEEDSGISTNAGKVTIDVTSEEETSATKAEIKVGSNALTSINENENVKEVELKTDVGTLTISDAAWNDMTAKATKGDETASVVIKLEDKSKEGSNPVYEVTATVGGENAFDGSGGGAVTISVPYAADGEKDNVKVYCTDNGKMEDMNAALSDGILSWTTSHFSTFEVVAYDETAEVTYQTTKDGTTSVSSGSFSDALTAVASNGGTITLLKDVTATNFNTTISKNVTIQGKEGLKINLTTGSTSRNKAFTVSKDAKLTLDGVTMMISGSGEEGQGIGDGFDVQYGGALELNNSNVTLSNLEAATISAKPQNSGEVGTGIFTLNHSTITATGIRGNFSNGGVWTLDSESAIEIDDCDAHGFSADRIEVKGNSNINVDNTAYRGISINSTGLGEDTNGGLIIETGSAVSVTNCGDKEHPAVFMTNDHAANLIVNEGAILNVSATEEGKSNTISLSTNNGSQDTLNGAVIGTVTKGEESPTTYYEITFNVTPSDANIVVKGSDGKAVSAVNGKYALEKDKTYTYEVSKSGYRTQTGTFTVTEAETISVTLSSSGGGGGGGGSVTTKYTLSFDTNGGSAIAKVTKEKGTTVDLGQYVPTREGYTFAGWYSDEALTQKVTSVKLNGNTTVYAKWTENAVTPTLPFTDVKSGDWFYEAVQYVYDKGMMTGVSADRFAPASTTTRGMIVTILYRLENEPAVSGGSAFTDVENGAWYADAVAWAAANDIVNGTSATTFAPNSPITREQMAAILYRYAAYKGYDVSQKADLSGYTDAASISGYAKDALAWANAQKLITGVTDTTLNPQGSATRAQVATILMRLCETVVK